MSANKILSALLATVGMLLIPLSTTALFAQEESFDSYGLRITPPTFELSANPGETVTNSIRVENITEGALPVVVEHRTFTASGDEGAINLLEESEINSMASWLSTTPVSIVIPSDEYRVFTFTITVPPNAEPGGHFGSVVFKTATQNTPDETGVALSQEIGSLVLLRVAGDIRESARIIDFSTDSKLYEQGPVRFETRVQNQGNVHVKTGGTITITDMFGKDVARVNMEPKNVLPDATRKIESTWDTKWLFGKYVASVAMYYGNGNQVITYTTSFWGFPYTIFSIILIVVLVVLFYVRKHKNRIQKALNVLVGKE